MEWTFEQKQAIETRGKNILVAAAAGSGKTAVLVERIKRLVLEEQVPIDRMLIVTFTNAAASEMKEKIAKALDKALDNGEGDSQYLREQLNILHRANISTFHAFGLEVIRRHFHLIDMEPDFKICDEAQKTILQGKAIDQLLEKLFEEGREDFFDFLRAFSSDRNEGRFKELVLSSYDKIMSIPEPWEWLDKSCKQLLDMKEDYTHSKLYEYILDDIKRTSQQMSMLARKIEEIFELNGLEKLSAKYALESADFARLEALAMAEDFEGFGMHIRSISYARLVAAKDEKEDYQEVKGTVDVYRKELKKLASALTKDYFGKSFPEQLEELQETYPRTMFLKECLEEFHKLYRQEKEKSKLIDFNDIEHYALEILKNDDAAAMYREKFRYIFIDEYQDSNLIQEALIGMIKRENNLFMVGDVKQSIYKFRLAEPEIFNEKYRAFKENTNDLSMKIDLNRNFRSKGGIIDFINKVFKVNMENYDEDAMLYKGDEYEGELDYQPELHIASDDRVETFEPEEAEEDNEAEVELVSLKKAEREAYAAVNIIQSSLGQKIWDSKLGEERPLMKRDVVILMRGARNYADIYSNILFANGLPAYVDDNDGYFNTIEIDVFLNLLTLLDNRKQDIPLLAVLRSEIFRFTIDQLVSIRVPSRKMSYYKAFMKYAKEGENQGLKDKCNEVLATLDRWKNFSQSMPLDRFIWTVMLESSYYLAVGALPGGNQRQANLRALVDKALNFIGSQGGSLANFIDYINAIKEKKVPMGQVKLIGEQDDIVRIMTVHKSKGLEFPMVIVAGVSKRQNFTSLGKGVTIHKDFGLSLSQVNLNEHWFRTTVLQRAIGRKKRREELEEEIRILYVALTRAKDKLILLGSKNNSEKMLAAFDKGISNQTSYLDMMGAMMMAEGYPIRIHNVNILEGQIASAKNGINKTLELFQNQEHCIDESMASEVQRRLSFKYPHSKALRTKCKYSVSEINSLGEGHKYDYKPQVPSFAQGERSFTSAEKGTIYHNLMEFIDFAQAKTGDAGYIQDSINAMVEKSILTQAEGDTINPERVFKFFQCELGTRAALAATRGQLYKEAPFDLQIEMGEEKVLVQGIIDCFFYEEDEIVLLDYKTNYVDETKDIEEEKERIKELYKGQMNLYIEALEKIKGKKVKEAYLFLQGIGDVVRMA